MDRVAPGVHRVRGADEVRIKEGQIASKVFTPDYSDSETGAFYEALKAAKR